VTVFVDDAVRGALPKVCVRDGTPTADALRRREDVGDRAGLGVAWLLLLAGPLVHPRFAAACEAHEASHGRRT